MDAQGNKSEEHGDGDGYEEGGQKGIHPAVHIFILHHPAKHEGLEDDIEGKDLETVISLANQWIQQEDEIQIAHQNSETNGDL